MERGYTPINPVVDNFNSELSRGVNKATQYGKYMNTLGHGKDLVISISDKDMHPAFEPGDSITIKPATIDQIRVGDFVFYRLGSMVVIRRVIRSVIKLGDTYLVTKAERSKTPEKPVKASQVVGKVIKLERKGRNMRVPNYASILNKLTCFGTVPFHTALIRKFLSFVPYVRVQDDLD
ncbi:MAG: hypothetical protein LWY06_01130 [Firmicutes bacterium]|nr:hypothetical protein [Bacillota bacterium]